jgi:molecular chaperone GrpE
MLVAFGPEMFVTFGPEMFVAFGPEMFVAFGPEMFVTFGPEALGGTGGAASCARAQGADTYCLMPPFLRRSTPEVPPEPVDDALPPTIDESGVVEAASPVATASPLEQELIAEREARLRIAADFANLRRRSTEEQARARAEGHEAALTPLIESADDLRRAAELLPEELIDHPWVAGIAAIARRLDERLAAAGLTPVGAIGEPFDPRLHEAVERLAHGAEGTIIAVRRLGYRSGDRVVRPAMVAVGGGEPESTTAHDTTPTKE